jgi:predicted 2-oxoglutarate/Fe(II)-dependent dioxygenase YbiX
MAKGILVPRFSPASIDPCFCRSGRAFGDCCGSRAADRKPPGGALVFPDFLDQATCGKWVQRLERQPRLRAAVNDINKSARAIEDPTRVCDDVKPGPMRKIIFDRVASGFAKAAQLTGRSLDWYETPRILRYQSGGFYQRHSDSCQVDGVSNQWFKVLDRDLSLLIYLNDDYTGGGLSFIHFNYHYRPRPGDLLVFPSDNRYEHQAEKVLSGVRYVIASWAAFKDNPRVFSQAPADAISFPG